MKGAQKISVIVLLFSIVIFFTSCEKLQELLTTVSGKVAAKSGTIVLALNGEGDAYEKLSEVNELNENALKAMTNIAKGFDLGTDKDSSYNVILTSGCTVYIVAISDDGDKQLDSLDLIGWYGETTTFEEGDTIIAGTDTIIVSSGPFTYTTPEAITIEEGSDIEGINIYNMMEYKLFLQ